MKTLFKISLNIFLIVFLSGITFAGDIKACFKNVCIDVEIAQTEAARTNGLMFRESLGEKEGMLFIFPEDCRPSFWMKNVKFALDMIWLDRNKKIVQINENVPTCTIVCDTVPAIRDCRYVFEVNTGFVAKNKIKVGDKVRF